jgi:integrase
LRRNAWRTNWSDKEGHDRASVKTKIGCHTFRATGITEYLRNGGKLEIAQQMENHESARTTGLYDRRGDQISLDEVERILIWMSWRLTEDNDQAFAPLKNHCGGPLRRSRTIMENSE